MEFNLNYLREILPLEMPPLAAVPEAVRRAYEERGFGEREGDGAELVRRSAYWTYAIFQAYREGRFYIRSDDPYWDDWFWHGRHFRNGGLWPEPRFGDMSVGALDPDYEGAGFGLKFIGLAKPESRIVGRIEFPDLKESFPIAQIALVDDPHAPPSPSNSVSACWASDNKSPGTWGVLTCRHSLSSVGVGVTLALTNGLPGVLNRKADPSIDAAYITCTPTAVPTALMTTDNFPAAGLAVDIQTSGGSVSRSVVSTMDTLGILNDPVFPVRVFLDRGATPGDSGSLVVDSAGVGVGIYSGAQTSVSGKHAGQRLGYAQLLEQAVQILDVQPFT